jgi:hypothetical protein
MKPRILSSILAALLVLALVPARATDEHVYAKGEYAIIRDGLAPGRQKSLASHADGEYGKNFHVWLMAEPGHRRLASLDGIGDSNNLDTGPNAYHALWSKDSRHVAVTHRSDRHVVEYNLYRVEGRRVHPVLGPSLFKDVTSRDIGRGDSLRRSVPEFEWKSKTRFLLREHRLLASSDPGFSRMLGAYSKVRDKRDDGQFFVEFSAEADCVVMPGNRYRIVDVRVGKFGEGDDW